MQKSLFFNNLYWCMDNQYSSLGSSDGNREDGSFMAGTNADDMKFEASTIYSRVNYKHFRLDAVEASRESRHVSLHSGEWVNEDELHPIGRLRRTVFSYRQYILGISHRAIHAEPQVKDNICRALGIPSEKLSPPDSWGKAAQVGMFLLPIPLSAMVIRAQKLIAHGRTIQGREYLYKHFIAATIGLDPKSYNESLDFVLRFLEPSNKREDFKEILRFHHSWLLVAYKLGLRAWKDILRVFQTIPTYSDKGTFYLMLVNEGAIKNIAELKATAKYIDRGYRSHAFPRDIKATRKVVRMLLNTGMSRQLVSSIADEKSSYLQPAELEKIIELLQEEDLLNATNMNTIYEAFGSLLWSSSSKRWQYVIRALGQKDIHDVIKFKRIIETGGDLSIEFGDTLLQHGLNPSELAQCQELMLTVGKAHSIAGAITSFKLLTSSPHNLDTEQICQCETYLSKSNNLDQFLAVLEKYGMEHAAGVLAFQRCYAVSYAENVDRLLAIATNSTNNETEDIISSWVCQASTARAIDELEYLTSVFNVTEVDQLYQLLKYGKMGKTLLRYLITKKDISSIAKMRNWYYKEAVDIQSVKLSGALKETHIQVLDYAYDSKCFSSVNGNIACIDLLVDKRVSAIVGKYPPQDTPETKESYWEKRSQVEDREIERLSKIIPGLLRDSGGVILPSVLTCAIEEPDKLSELVKKLDPLINEILMGGGPINASLTDFEKDAISLVYKTDRRTLESYWAQAVGKMSHIAGLKIRQAYPMRWGQTSQRLKRPLDRRGLEVFSGATTFAQNFKKNYLNDMHLACKYLSPKKILDDAADTHNLRFHLGLLLVISEHVTTPIWDKKSFDQLYLLEEDDISAFNALTVLQSFFKVTLIDDIAAKMKEFTSKLDDQKVIQLAEKVMRNSQSCEDARALLLFSLTKSADVISKVYGRWIKAELAKFDTVQNAECGTELVSVVTKSPAAFFAKHTVNLCTSGRADLWDESRHSHLIVFDSKQRCMVGMAAIYIELVEKLHATVPVLIIRAINPVDDMLSRHDVNSIIKSFIGVAIEIAKDNNLCAVALSDEDGTHLLSNKTAIGNALMQRYIKKSVSLFSRIDSASESQSWESQPKYVSDCFFAYEYGGGSKTGLHVLWKGQCS